MLQETLLLAGKITLHPRVRAHMAKAMALAALFISLPVYGHGEDVASATQAAASKTHPDGANSPPVAVTDHLNLKDAAHGINVLSNDTDINLDTLSVIEASARFGAVAYTSDGLIAYAANQAQPQADEIIYVVSDGRGGQARGLVIVSVQ